MISSRKFKEISKTHLGYDIATDGPVIRMIFLTDDIIRIRASFDGTFSEASYCLALTAWEDDLDGLLGADRNRIAPLDIPVEDKGEYLLFTTETLRIQLVKEPFGFRVFDEKGRMIYSDLLGRSFVRDHLGRIFHYSRMEAESDHFFGFGERAGYLDKKETRMRLTPKDAIGHDPEFADPMYKHIPFYIRTNENVRHALGLFYHNSYDTVFDMGNEISGYYDRYVYYSAEGGDVDLFLINGPAVKDVLANYTLLTGRQAMPPKQSLGFAISTMYYGELEKDCDREISYVVDKHKREKIYADSFKMSSGYTTGKGNQKRYVFNWNTDKFSDPQRFFDEMNEKGINLIPNIKPGILLTHPFMDLFEKNDVFVRNSDDSGYFEGPWWGGTGRYFDFTRESARKVWKDLLKKQLISKGTVSVWNDNCEYDGVEDREAVFHFEGKKGRAANLRILQGNIMARIAVEAVREVFPDKRPYVINRAGFAGIQKYAQTWSGDNLTDWKTPKFNIATILGMGLSGVANTGCDIGGFAGNAPEAELLLRWIQNGIFQPRFCINSANKDNKVTEAWMYESQNDFVREAWALRYRLISYMYSLLYEAHETGAPIMRPLFYEFEDDPQCYSDRSLTFMLGSSLLVANVLEKGAKTRKLYLPQGTGWYRIDDRMTRFEGGQWIEIPVDLSSIPLFLREDGLFIMNNLISNIRNEDISRLDLYVGGGETSQILYEDDGVSNDWEKGVFRKTGIAVTGESRRTITFTPEGPYKSAVETLVVHSIHPVKSAYWVTLDGEKLKQYLQREEWEQVEEGWCYNGDENAVLVKFKNPVSSAELVISYDFFDLIGMEEGIGLDLN